MAGRRRYLSVRPGWSLRCATPRACSQAFNACGFVSNIDVWFWALSASW